MPTFPISTNANTPMITFHPAGGDSITLPVPAGIAFADTAEYAGAALGALGGATLAGMQAGFEGGLEGIKSAGTQRLKDIKNSGMLNAGVEGTFLTSRLAGKVAGEGVAKAIGIGLGRAANANTTAEFTGVAIRNFSFSYKLVPSSAKEAEIIANIVRIFRENLYPEKSASGLTLKYPPLWDITIDGDSKIFPTIEECFLSTLNTTVNDGGNAWHVDGAPVETNISFTFMERRALTKQDIK